MPSRPLGREAPALLCEVAENDLMPEINWPFESGRVFTVLMTAVHKLEVAEGRLKCGPPEANCTTNKY